MESQEVGEGVSFSLVWVLRTLSFSTHLFPMDIFGASRASSWSLLPSSLQKGQWKESRPYLLPAGTTYTCIESCSWIRVSVLKAPITELGWHFLSPHQTCLHPGPAVLSPCNCQLCLSRDGSRIFCPLVISHLLLQRYSFLISMLWATPGPQANICQMNPGSVPAGLRGYVF